MKTRLQLLLFALALLVALPRFSPVFAQGAATFPIATNSGLAEAVYTGCLATSGTNYLVAVTTGSHVGYQLITTNGTLSGPLVTTGAGSKIPKAAFAGTNYLVYWFDNGADNLEAQLVSPGGAKVGSPISLGAAESQGAQCLLSDGTNFLLVWEDSGGAGYFGQLMTSAGVLSGSSFLIAAENKNLEGDFGATNYLFVWQEDTPYDTYGVFVSTSGQVGNPFQINETTSLNQNPPAVGFDGGNYFVLWNGDTAQTATGLPLWNLYGRLVSPEGDLDSDELLLNTSQPVFPSLAFDGTNYLMGWGHDTDTAHTDKSVLFQFYDTTATPVGPSFSPFSPRGASLPLFGTEVFDGSRFMATATLGALELEANGKVEGLTSGAVYGAFIPTTATPPTVVTEPLGATNLEGTTATFTLGATGPSLEYQWFKNHASLAASSRISGVATATLTISNLALADAGTYTVVVDNVFGTVTSSNAELAVLTPAVITTGVNLHGVGSVTGAAAVAPGTQVTLTVTVTNGCYYFTNWTVAGRVVTNSPVYMFAAEHSEEAVANFAQYAYLIQTASAPPNGGTTSGGGTKGCGTVDHILAHASTGFRFVNWTAGDVLVSTEATYPFTVSGPVLLTANFVNTALPTLTVTHPVGLVTTTSNTVTLEGTAHDNVAVTNVSATNSAPGAGPIQVDSGNHWSNWTATVALALGTNVIEVQAMDSVGLPSAIKTVTIIRAPVPMVFPIVTTGIIQHPQAQAAFDGSNYLVAFQTYVIANGNSNSPGNAQFVSPGGALVGSVLDLNPGGAGDPPALAFGQSNYLAAWADHSESANGVPIVGTFIAPDGGLQGPAVVTQSTTVDTFGSMSFGGGVYFLMWSDYRNSPESDAIYGVMVTPSGTVAASDFLISATGEQSEAGQGGVASDGTNFLATWAGTSGNASVTGRIIAPDGSFVTDPFTIDATPVSGKALTCAVFDGTKYLVLFNPGLSGPISGWHILGRFVTPAGVVLTNQITLTTDGGPQDIPGATFDGTDYLITWNQGFDPISTANSTSKINARFFNAEGRPTTSEFELFAPGNNRFPLSAPVLWDGTKFFSVAGLGKQTAASPNLRFTNGVISGAFVSP